MLRHEGLRANDQAKKRESQNAANEKATKRSSQAAAFSPIGSQSTFCKQIAPTKGTALLPRSPHGPSQAIETHAARSGNHAASPSNFKGLFVPLRIVILFKNLANSEKAVTDTEIKPFSCSCRMQIAHQGNSLPLDRYSFSQRQKQSQSRWLHFGNDD